MDSTFFHQWATSSLSLIKRVFGEDSDHYVNFRKIYDDYSGYSYEFDKCAGILAAAVDDFQGGYLFTLRSLVTADVLDDSLEQATELLDNGYKDPACIVTGISLESALKDLASRNGVAPGKMDKMNADLAKLGVYNKGMQKQITAWAHWRNKAAHGEWNEYKNDDVRDMIAGVNRFVAEYL